MIGRDVIQCETASAGPGYPEGASPGECIAIDVDRFVNERERRLTLDPVGLGLVQSEFDRLSRWHGATQVVIMTLGWPLSPTAILAVANAGNWCAVLLRAGLHDVGVFVPTVAP
jgi:hypothetical protein